MKCVKRDLRLFWGNVKLCLGRRSCIKHAYHAIGRKNAYDSLNRELALRNIRKLCPTNNKAVRNSHKTPSDHFSDMKVIMSQVTKQGDSIAMTIYGLAIFSLIDKHADQI